MNESPAEPERAAEDAAIEAAIDEVLGLCGGDPRAAIAALLVANEFLEAERERLAGMVSRGYAGGLLRSD